MSSLHDCNRCDLYFNTNCKMVREKNAAVYDVAVFVRCSQTQTEERNGKLHHTHERVTLFMQDCANFVLYFSTSPYRTTHSCSRVYESYKLLLRSVEYALRSYN